MPLSLFPPVQPLGRVTVGNQPGQHNLLRLLRYALAYKWLVFITVAAGFVQVGLGYSFPYLIGTIIDQIVLTNPPRPDSGIFAGVPQIFPWLSGPEVRETLAPEEMQKRTDTLVRYILFGMAAGLGSAAISYTLGHTRAILTHRIVTQIRRDLFDHLQRLSLHFYSKARTGSIAARLLHDVESATAIINGGVITVWLDIIKLGMAIVLLVGISPKLAAAVILVLPLYGLTFTIMNPRVRKASERVHQYYAQISGTIQEQFSGIALTKTYAAEERESQRFTQETGEQYARIIMQSRVGHFVGSVSEALVHSGTVIAFGYGGYLGLKGELTPGQLSAFIGYLMLMYDPVRRFAELNTIYQASLASIARVFRVFDITPKITDRPHAVSQPPDRGEVKFDNVFFRYHDESEESRAGMEDTPGGAGAHAGEIPWVLKGINLHVRPGERIAIVGPSGSGKTTLVTLLPRLYDVGEGAIIIDGHDVRDFQLRALRRAIGIVQQDAFLFSGSIRDNIRYGRPGASDEEMIAAARGANAHEFIMRLRDGYGTLLGERGVNLSGGQRQRLSIARAILKDPRILILDEATSALDTESEALVQQALERLMEGRTCFIIAHRLSTVRNADRIVVLKDGAVHEIGSHDELMTRNGLYAKLVRQQFLTREQQRKAMGAEADASTSELALQEAMQNPAGE
jgi:subfamily B ATP-binding cassette protein MsbA